MFNLKVQKDGSKFKRLLKEPEYQKIVDLLTSGKRRWKAMKKTLFESIARGFLTEEAKVWFYFVSSILLPSKHLSTVRRNEAILLYALLKGYKINVGKIIENYFMSYSISKCRGLIPHPAIITKLCLLGGVIGDWDVEERCPKVSPLTLTGVMKGPKNKEKNKERETEEEMGNERDNEPAHWESPPQDQQEIQISLSPIWNVSPDIREVR